MRIHPNIVRHWVEAESDGAGKHFVRWIGVIVTDAIGLDGAQSVDSSVMEDIIAAVRETHSNLSFDGFRIVPDGVT